MLNLISEKDKQEIKKELTAIVEGAMERTMQKYPRCQQTAARVTHNGRATVQCEKIAGHMDMCCNGTYLWNT